jgi:hypothetical protein
MKVQVFHNDARGSMFDGFDRKLAALLLVAEFDLDVPEPTYVHPDASPTTLEAITASLDAYDAQFTAQLGAIYEQLNIGGDLVPATEWTQAYRAAGNRSLSVGDVIVLDEHKAFAVARFGFDKISNAMVRWGVIRYDANVDPETKMWRLDNAAVSA